MATKRKCTKPIFFSTREECRRYAFSEGGYPKDAGKDAPKGKRWFI